MRMPCEPTLKSTPNRRRGPASRPRASYQKNYVSENDLPSYKHNDVAAPRTPQKHVASRVTATTAATTAIATTTTNANTSVKPQSTGRKHKNGSNVNNAKNRSAKNGAASPGRRRDGESPSPQSQEASARTFAGSSFHASPAPSALPLPRFLGMASADSPSVKVSLADSSPESSPSPDSDGLTLADTTPRDESPLEFFFRADRAERARVRRASSANADTTSTSTFSPLQDSPQNESNTIPKATAYTSLRRPMFADIDASPGISTDERDGGSRLSIGPAFSTPYQERIRAARLSENLARQTPTASRDMDANSSEALKRYLFTGQLSRSEPQEFLPHSSPSTRTRFHVAQQQYTPGDRQERIRQSSPNSTRGIFPASVLAGHAPRVEAAPISAVNPDSSARPQHILALEGDLRRMLKLDSLG